MQAILTKYIGPTNTKGSRIKAECDAGSITISYPSCSNTPHLVAAKKLVEKLGWNCELIEGVLKDNNHVFVIKE